VSTAECSNLGRRRNASVLHFPQGGNTMRATWVPAMLLVVFLSACGGGGDGAGADECADPVAVSSVEITGKGSGYEPDCLSRSTQARRSR
jgi:hypothetical protein